MFEGFKTEYQVNAADFSHPLIGTLEKGDIMKKNVAKSVRKCQEEGYLVMSQDGSFILEEPEEEKKVDYKKFAKRGLAITAAVTAAVVSASLLAVKLLSNSVSLEEFEDGDGSEAEPDANIEDISDEGEES